MGCLVAALGCLLWGCQLAFQVYTYLRSGEWIPISVVDLVRLLGVSPEGWWYYPTDWTGLYAVLDFLPLGAAVLIVGCVGAWLEAWSNE